MLSCISDTYLGNIIPPATKLRIEKVERKLRRLGILTLPPNTHCSLISISLSQCRRIKIKVRDVEILSFFNTTKIFYTERSK
jgi:hypothetical protein